MESTLSMSGDLKRRPAHPDDRSRIKAAQNGDLEAFSGLIRDHQAKVLGLCRAYLLNPSDAEDAAQDVFVKAFHNIKTFRFESAFSTWMYTIARRHCLDLLRAAKRRESVSWDMLLEKGERAEPAEISPVEPAAGAEELRDAFSSLPPDYREILALREFQELSYEDAARVSGVTVDSVKARLRRARAALRERVRHVLAARGVSMDGGAQ